MAVQADISLSDIVPCSSDMYRTAAVAFFTAYSKGFRYSSRSACSLTHVAIPPPLTRFVSCSLTAKCLMVQYTPLLAAPDTHADAIAPDSRGSSE